MTLSSSLPAAAAASTAVPAAWALHCTAFDAPTPDQLRVQTDALICVNAQGVIDAVLQPGDPRWARERAAHAAAGTLRFRVDGGVLTVLAVEEARGNEVCQ